MGVLKSVLNLIILLSVTIILSCSSDSGGPAHSSGSPFDPGGISQIEQEFSAEIETLNENLNSDGAYEFTQEELDSLFLDGLISEEDYQKLSLLLKKEV